MSVNFTAPTILTQALANARVQHLGHRVLDSPRDTEGLFSIVFLIIAIWPILNQNEIRIWSIIISLIFLILGLINSKFLSPLNKAWFKFGLILGSVIAPIVMGIVFFLVVK